jgi:hypothetical protein
VHPAPGIQVISEEDTERLLQPEEEDQVATGENLTSGRVLEREDFTAKRTGNGGNEWSHLTWSFGAAAGITVSMAPAPVVGVY